ncbi:helix-turn-helix domain-containing protein [Thermincola ferriacetica]
MINGKKIQALRKTKGFSLRQISQLANGQISPSYLSEIENGKVKNPSKKIARALAKALGVREFELFTFEDYVEGEFKMCKYRMEYPTMNGWVYYCDLVARGKNITKKELEEVGCTEVERAKCKQMMELTCGMGIVPEPRE